MFRNVLSRLACTLSIGLCLIATAVGDEQEEVKRLEGTWKLNFLEVSGVRVDDANIPKIQLIFGADGSWNSTLDEKDLGQGTSSLQPKAEPKGIDLKVTVGENAGKTIYGIYELKDDALTLCVGAADEARPTEFASPGGTKLLLLKFERVKQ